METLKKSRPTSAMPITWIGSICRARLFYYPAPRTPPPPPLLSSRSGTAPANSFPSPWRAQEVTACWCLVPAPPLPPPVTASGDSRKTEKQLGMFGRSDQNGSVVSLSLARMLELHWASDIITEGGNSINAVVGRERERERRRQGVGLVSRLWPLMKAVIEKTLLLKVKLADSGGICVFLEG